VCKYTCEYSDIKDYAYSSSPALLQPQQTSFKLHLSTSSTQRLFFYTLLLYYRDRSVWCFFYHFIPSSHKPVKDLWRNVRFSTKHLVRHATLFDLLCFFVHDTGRNRRKTLLLLGCCRLEATGCRLEAGLQAECCGFSFFF
jgi:hypothetical protein